jgi:hypothetical protein
LQKLEFVQGVSSCNPQGRKRDSVCEAKLRVGSSG